ncbi:MAG: hypothetical protein AAFY99_10100 [Pseudomonadota bacterium]
MVGATVGGDGVGDMVGATVGGDGVGDMVGATVGGDGVGDMVGAVVGEGVATTLTELCAKTSFGRFTATMTGATQARFTTSRRV